MEKLKVQVTQIYPICTEEAFKIWSNYKGNIISRTKPYLLQPRRSNRIEKKRKISLQEVKGEEKDVAHGDFHTHRTGGLRYNYVYIVYFRLFFCDSLHDYIFT